MKKNGWEEKRNKRQKKEGTYMRYGIREGMKKNEWMKKTCQKKLWKVEEEKCLIKNTIF